MKLLRKVVLENFESGMRIIRPTTNTLGKPNNAKTNDNISLHGVIARKSMGTRNAADLHQNAPPDPPAPTNPDALPKKRATPKKATREDAGVIPLTLPMIAESNRARRAYTKQKKQEVLNKLYTAKRKKLAQAKNDEFKQARIERDSPVSDETPGKLKFKQKEFDLGEKEGGYYKFLQGEKQREKASKREFEKHRSLSRDPDDEQKADAFDGYRRRAR